MKDGQAQQEEMQRARRVAAAEIHEQADGQIHRAHGVLIEDGRIALRLADDDVGRNFDAAVVQDGVLGFSPRAQPRQNLGGLQRILNLDAFNGEQNVARMKPRFRAGAAGLDSQRDNPNSIAGGLIDPDYAVIGQMVFTLLIEIEPRGNDSRNGHNDQQRADEL